VETPAVDRQTLDEIVTGWEDEYNLLLGDIKQRMLEKAASAQEVEQVNNLERIVLVYDLMMKSVMERKGTWPYDLKQSKTEDNLKIIADKISNELDATPQLILDTLNHAQQKGDLMCQETDGMIRWQWTDYL